MSGEKQSPDTIQDMLELATSEEIAAMAVVFDLKGHTALGVAVVTWAITRGMPYADPPETPFEAQKVIRAFITRVREEWPDFISNEDMMTWALGAGSQN